MANYLSQKIDFAEPFKAMNTPLVANVLAAKQGQYNIGKQKLTSAIDAFENLKVLRPEDQEYIEAKLTDLKSRLDEDSYKDFSDTNLSDSLMSSIKSAAKDPFVINAMANTQKFNNYQQEIANLKGKKDGGYADQNYAYSLYKAGVQDYMDGKSNAIGNLSYTAYTDLTEEHLKRIKTIKDIKGKRFIEELSPDGKFKIRKEIEGLTDNEILNYLSSTMSPQENKQMEINGWAKYGSDKQGAVERLKSFNSEKLTQLDSEIAINEAISSNNNLSQGERNEANNKLQILNSQKEGLNVDYTNVPVEQVALQLERNSYLNGLSQMAKSEWSTSFDTNDAYYKDRELEIKYEELAIKKAKLAQENGLNPDGTPVSGATSSSPREEKLGEVEGFKSYEKEHDSHYNNILNIGKELNSKILSTDDKEVFAKNLRAHGIDPTTMKWIDAEKNKDKSITATLVKAFEVSGFATLYPEQAKELQESLTKKQNLAVDLVNVEGDAILRTFSKDADGYVESLKNSLYSMTSLPAEMSLLRGLSVSKPITEAEANATAIKAKTDAFVKKVGGWDKMKSVISSDRKLALEFSELSNEADKAWKGVGQMFNLLPGEVFRDKNLKEDAQKTAEEILKNRSNDGSLAYHTVYNQINILSEGVRKTIIERIPASKYTNSDSVISQRFDPKLELTIYKKGETIVMEQHQGTMGSGKNLTNKTSTVEFNPQDSAYLEIMKYVDLEEGKKGLDATRTVIDIPATKPKMIPTAENSKLKPQGEALNNIYAQMGANQRVFTVAPSSFINEDYTEKTFMAHLAPYYNKEQLQAFTSNYTANLKNYSLKLAKVKEKGVTTWCAIISNEKGEPIYDGSIGVQNLDSNMQYLFKNFPQTIISNYVFKTLLDEKSEKTLNTVLNGI